MSSVQTSAGDTNDMEPTLQFLEAPRLGPTSTIRPEQRTEHAVRLFDFAGVFTTEFAHRTYGVRRPRRVRLTDPDEATTAGGKLARRSILLVPDDGQRDTLVIGWVDIVQCTSELRSFESLGQYFQERFGHALDVAPHEYVTLSDDIARLFEKEGIVITVLPPAVRTSSASVLPPQPDQAADQGWLFWLVGLLTGFALGYAVFAA